MSESSTISRQRLDTVDLLRGVIMVVMLLDHTRDFVHASGFGWDPTDLTRTSWAMFLTRWVTHYCAPIFVLLSGVAIFFQEQRGKPRAELAKFLLTRGLWLVFLEMTVLRLLIFFSFDFRLLAAWQVIFALGFSMIVMAALIHLPWKVVGALGAVIVMGHNALDGIRFAPWAGPPNPVPGLGAQLWTVLHQQGAITPFGFPGPVVFVLYPVLAWVGVMGCGYALGRVWTLDIPARREFLLRIGLAATALFVLLRAVNLYGDPAPWSVQPRGPLFTALSFLNTTKYPPSLLFLAMTIGPGLILLSQLEGRDLTGRIARFFVTFGRVPLFFYILQWVVAHAGGLLLALAFGRSTHFLLGSPLTWGPPPAGELGFRLWVVYAAWIAGVALLYPLCCWFAGIKARRREWWLSYL